MTSSSFTRIGFWVVIGIVLACLPPSKAIDQQHLDPEDGLFLRKRNLAYYDRLYDVLIVQHAAFMVARTVCIPTSSGTEWTVTVEGRPDSTYFLIATTPQKQLGVALLMNPKVKLATLKKTKILRFEKQISREDAERIGEMFLSITAETRYSGRPWIVLDGETYHFSVLKAAVGSYSGQTMSPEDGTPPSHLVSLSKTLFEYAKADRSSEGAILERVRSRLRDFLKEMRFN